MTSTGNGEAQRGEPKKRGRWDQTIDEQFVPAKKSASGALTPTWGDTDKTPAVHQWDATPGHKGSETPGATPSARIWDATPAHHATTPGHDAQEKSVRRNRWDEV